MSRRAMVVAVLLLTVAACGTDAGKSPQPSSNASPESAGGAASSGAGTTALPAQARTALGDLTTLDPCSLVRPADFAAFGTATFGDPQSLDYCVVEVQESGAQTEIHVGEIVDASYRLNRAATGASAIGGAPLPSGQQLQSTGIGGDTCQSELLFTDHLGLLVTATPSDGPATLSTCKLSTAAMSGAMSAIAAHQVAHRTYPAHSFGPVDACTVLTRAVVSAALTSLAGVKPHAHPARHQCEYGASGDGTTYAALVLGAAYARFDGGPGSTTLTVAGHQVVLVPEQPDGRGGECVGYGPHIAFPSKSGQPAMEMAELHVALPSTATDDRACADVKALARTVFAHLP
jgi:hypothetical protein